LKITILRRHECSKAQGLCVVIDVLRAFTTAAFAFAAGAQEIILVSSPDEAFQKHRSDPSLLLMGEQDGRLIQGFHFGNSPADIQRVDLSGKRLVQRTSAGTQGVVSCKHANQILLASFVVAEATIKRILEINPSHLSFIVTGVHNGDEDLALAEYMQCKLMQQDVSLEPFLDRVRNSPEGITFTDPAIGEFSTQDLHLALQVNRFAFAMEVVQNQGCMIAKQLPMG